MGKGINNPSPLGYDEISLYDNKNRSINQSEGGGLGGGLPVTVQLSDHELISLSTHCQESTTGWNEGQSTRRLIFQSSQCSGQGSEGLLNLRPFVQHEAIFSGEADRSHLWHSFMWKNLSLSLPSIQPRAIGRVKFCAMPVTYAAVREVGGKSRSFIMEVVVFVLVL